MTLTNSQPHIEPVWVQNLKGFINGVFPADDTWKRIFVKQLDAAAGRIDELEEENTRLQLLLLAKPAERRQMHISDCLKREGSIRRIDIIVTFGVSVAQASHDIRDWLTAHPGEAVYNTSTKRYEAAVQHG